MANITNTLIANITATEDSSNNIPINRSTGNQAFDSVFSEFVSYFNLANGANVISLAGGTVNQITQVYLRVLDPVKSVVVTWTPGAGGGALAVLTLYPNDQFIIWQKPGGANAGIISLSLTPSAAPCLIEYFIGG